jgi:hypothetical protein
MRKRRSMRRRLLSSTRGKLAAFSAFPGALYNQRGWVSWTKLVTCELVSVKGG